MGKSGIPDRWLPYTPMGSVIEGTRFIACKVPLKEALLRNVKEEDRFGLHNLLETYPQLGLMIDVTNTFRYYNKEEITEHNVKYEKICCPGHEIPPDRVVMRFFDAVDKFLNNKSNNDRLIAVHCTHGVNRTGYLICRYMIARMGVIPKEAVERFAVARGHKIERKNYLIDLLNGSIEEVESYLEFKLPAQKRRIDGSLADHQEMRYTNWRLECRQPTNDSNSSPVSSKQFRSDLQRERKNKAVRSLDFQETRYSNNWRIECRQPGDGSNISPVSSRPQPVTPLAPAEGPSEFQWTPDDNLRPPPLPRGHKVYTPYSTKPFKRNIQLPHYGMPSVSYDRVRDDDQWNNEEELIKRTVQQSQAQGRRRYGRGRRGQGQYFRR